MSGSVRIMHRSYPKGSDIASHELIRVGDEDESAIYLWAVRVGEGHGVSGTATSIASAYEQMDLAALRLTPKRDA